MSEIKKIDIKKEKAQENEYFYFPSYEISLQNIDGSNTWTISGEVKGLSEELANNVGIYAKKVPEEVVEKTVERTQKEKEKHDKDGLIMTLVGIGTLGCLLSSILLTDGCYVRVVNVDDNNEQPIIETEEPADDMTTIYAVETESGVFENLYYLTGLDWKINKSNIAALRGVSSLDDEDYATYSKDIGYVCAVSDLISDGKELDLNELLGCFEDLYNMSDIARQDIDSFRAKVGQEDNYEILTDNYKIVSNVYEIARDAIEEIDYLNSIEEDYKDTEVISWHDYGHAYGFKNNDLMIFYTYEEAKEYFDSHYKDFESHIINDGYNDLYDGEHSFIYDSLLKEYKTEDPDKLIDRLEKGYPPFEEEDVVDHHSHSGFRGNGM